MKDTLLLSLTDKVTEAPIVYRACSGKWVSQDLHPGSLVIESINLPPSLYIPELPCPLDPTEQETIRLSTEAVGL